MSKAPGTRVLLTVPHYYCRDDENAGHLCDITAGTAAAIIQEKLVQSGQDSQVIKSEVWRGKCDSNRPWCRKLPFRLKINSQISPTTAVLDIHSFPLGGFGNPEDMVVLLSLKQYDPVAELLILALKSREIRARLLQGSYLNDIMLQSMETARYTLLLEFYEGLTQQQLNTIADVVTNWVPEIQAILQPNSKSTIWRSAPQLLRPQISG